MKKLYVSPNVWAVTISTNEMIASSWDKEDTGGIDHTPGGQGSYGSKEDDELDLEW